MQELKGVERPAETLSEDNFLKAIAAPEQTIEIPELGGKVTIAPLTLDVRDRVNRLSKAEGHGEVNNAKFTALTVIHGMLKPRLGMDKVSLLLAANPKAMDRIAKAIWTLSGLSEEEAKNA